MPVRLSNNKESEMKPPSSLTRNGWIAFLVLVPIAYVVYYTIINPRFIEIYESNFWQPVATSKETSVLKLQVKIPKYIGDAETVERQMIVSVSNPLTQTKSLVLSVAGSLTGTIQGAAINPEVFTPTLRIATSPLASDNGNGRNTLEFHIPAFGSVSQSLWLSVERSSSIQLTDTITAELSFNSDVLGSPIRFTTGLSDGDKQATSFNRISAFKHSAIKTLALPPLANGLLPALVFGAVWLSENHWLRQLYSLFRSKKGGTGERGSKPDTGGIAKTRFVDFWNSNKSDWFEFFEVCASSALLLLYCWWVTYLVMQDKPTLLWPQLLIFIIVLLWTLHPESLGKELDESSKRLTNVEATLKQTATNLTAIDSKIETAIAATQARPIFLKDDLIAIKEGLADVLRERHGFVAETLKTSLEMVNKAQTQNIATCPGCGAAQAITRAVCFNCNRNLQDGE